MLSIVEDRGIRLFRVFVIEYFWNLKQFETKLEGAHTSFESPLRSWFEKNRKCFVTMSLKQHVFCTDHGSQLGQNLPINVKKYKQKTEISVIQFSYQRMYKKRRAGVTLMSCSWTVPGPDRPGG
jgi:hypothetical protein